MRHPIIYALLSLLLLVGCAHQHQRGEYEVLGTVEGLDDGDTIYVTNDLQDLKQTDTLIVKDQKFSFRGNTDSSRLYAVYSAEDKAVMTPFFVEPGTINVSLSNRRLGSVSGTENNEQLQEVNDSLMYFIEKQNDLMVSMHSSGSTSKALYDKSMKELNALYERVNRYMYDTAERNIDNDLGYLIIGVYTKGLIVGNGDREKIKERLDLIERLPEDKRALMQDEIELLKKYLEPDDAVQTEGGMLNDILLPDNEGNKVSVLAEVKKHKVTVIDFWASWCAPCMRAVPDMVQLWNKYKDKGLGIIGISLDTDRKAWNKAIQSKGMTWQHVSDLAGWDSEAAREYNIQAIPATLLVDKEGKILQADLGNIEQLTERIEEELK